jgi:hypothetical protein
MQLTPATYNLQKEQFCILCSDEKQQIHVFVFIMFIKLIISKGNMPSERKSITKRH